MIGVIEFDVRTPYDDATMRERVARNLKRGLPEAGRAPDHDGVLTIVANGPSAIHADTRGTTLALNGAIRLFSDEGWAPDYWAACDPQPVVASFLPSAPLGTRYFVASKCDDAVFDALGNRDVTMWHVGDAHPEGIPTACSITLVAMGLFRRMGWRRFRTWGWDGCYLDGRDHAVPQGHAGQDVTVIVGDTPYKTTTTWACEAQDAVNQLAVADYDVEVMGGGMIAAILKAHGIGL